MNANERKKHRAREHYRERRAAGLCRCGKAVASGKSWCVQCLKRIAEWSAQRLARRKATGACQVCGRNKPLFEKTVCDECRENIIDNTVTRRERLRSIGLCVFCGTRPAHAPKDRCAPCIAASACSGERTSE